MSSRMSSSPPSPTMGPLEQLFHKLDVDWSMKRDNLRENHGVSLLEANLRRNRYTNILPLDETRVILKEYDHDYINANYIRGVDGERGYIGCQAPLPGTLRDFYHMIWQDNVHVVVMLTKDEEAEVGKCHVYWPATPADAPLSFPPFQITLKDDQLVHDTRVRKLAVFHTELQLERIVSHVQFTAWPDHGVPRDPRPILELLATANRMAQEAKSTSDDVSVGPMVVHCSAGVGRTGTLIAIDIGCRQLLSGVRPNVYAIVDEMRKQRRRMVQTQDQFAFVQMALDTVEAEKKADSSL